MRKFLLFSLPVILSTGLFTPTLRAQTTITPGTWTGSGTTAAGPSTFGTVPASSTPGSSAVNVSQWNRGAGLADAGTAATAYVSKSWSYGTTLAAAKAAGSYVYFVVTNNASTELDITKISLTSSENTSGPTQAQIQYATGSSGDMNFGSALTITPGSTSSLVFTAASAIYLCAGQSDTFKVYAWGASSGAGTLSIDNNTGITAKYSTAISTVISVASGLPVCQGTTLSLASTTTGGVSSMTGFGPPPHLVYSWTGPGGFTSNRPNPNPIPGVNASSTGTYSLTVTDSFGCKSNVTYNLTVVPTPSLPTITPDPVGGITLCSNDSVLLSTPVVTGYTYQWDTGAYATPYAIPGATNSSYYAHRQGRYRVTVTNSGGCSAEGTPPDSIKVVPSPVATVTASGPLAFCTGGSVTLTATTSAGYSFQWYKNGASISGANTSVYTDTNTGNYTVKVTATNGCSEFSTGDIVTKLTTPVISTTNATSFCAGGSALLSVDIANGATGLNIKWIKNGIDTIVGATTVSYVASTSGDYTCYVSVPSGCSATSNDIPVSANPIPNPLIVLSGFTATTYNYYATYQWYLNTMTIPGATNYSITAYSNGSYRVMVTDTNGCSKLSNAFIINDLAVNNVNTAAPVKIYPNPATDVLNIDAADAAKIVVSTMEGSTVISNTAVTELNISKLASGLYLISVYDKSGNRLAVEKFVKK